MPERYLCIHGHFYQPPRENPWLERIEMQDSAYPYHDWNERIAAECYGPNARSRILDGEGRIVNIVNNYARISFNFGPTLLKWLADEQPELYAAVIQADRESMERFSGHGSALAQAWGHMILPLANRRDKATQVVWGVRDFEYRFGRRPEGMWLPETAVDLETLEVLAENGIKFTILAPHQAARVRRLGRGGPWKDISGGQIDPTRAYSARLPSGRRIALFFYDGPISRAVAFEGLLASGEAFAERLMSGFSDARDWPQLVHIATDGESYGHHHRFGDMALAYALQRVEADGGVRLTNYGEYLERFPPQHEVEIIENTSWSCAHGVERWRSDCGCRTGGPPHWNQAWRAPLRDALDWLRDALAAPWQQEAGRLLRDPWAARDDYISVILHRRDNEEKFFQRHALRPLSPEEKTQALKLMELQRHAMLMYTSCGWFFNDLSGIETLQVLQYAGRVNQLARDALGLDLEPAFLGRLEAAKSNIPESGDGRSLYERFVRPAVVDLADVGAHFAVSSLFRPFEERERIYCYTADVEEYRASAAGAARLAVGRLIVASEITHESQALSFGVLHLGDHNITAGVRPFPGEDEHHRRLADLEEPFARADLPAVIRALDRHFEGCIYSFRSLFRDEQRRVLDLVLASSLEETEATYRQVHEHHAPLMRFLLDIGLPLPRAFQAAAEEVTNANLRRALGDPRTDPERVRGLLEEARTWQVTLDTAGLAYAFQQNLERLAREFRDNPQDTALMDRLAGLVALIPELPFEVNLWQVQNDYWHVLKNRYPELLPTTEERDEAARAWAERFAALGLALHIRVE